jgi:hypothetical protein
MRPQQQPGQAPRVQEANGPVVHESLPDPRKARRPHGTARGLSSERCIRAAYRGIRARMLQRDPRTQPTATLHCVLRTPTPRGVMVFSSGARALRYPDETPAPSEWEQGVLPGWESEQDLRPSTHAPTTAIFTVIVILALVALSSYTETHARTSALVRVRLRPLSEEARPTMISRPAPEHDSRKLVCTDGTPPWPFTLEVGPKRMHRKVRTHG